MTDDLEVLEPSLARRAGFAMAWGQAGKVIEIALTTAIAIIAVRALQPHGFGLYSLLTNLAGTASVLIPLVSVEALGAVLPRFADGRLRLYIFAAVTLARLAVIAVVAVVGISLWDVVRGGLGLAPIPLSVLFAAAGYWVAQDLLNSVAAYYQAALDLRRVTLWRTGGQLFTLAALSTVVALDLVSVGSMLAVVAGGYLLGVAGLVAGLRSKGRPQRPPAAQLRFVFGFTRNVWLLGLATLALGPQMYVVLIGAITEDATEVAYYVAAVAVLGRAQILLVSGWSSLIIPTLGALHHRDGLAGLAHAWRLFTKFWLLVALPTNALLFVLAEPLIHVLFGEAYDPAVSFLRLVAVFGFVSAFLAGAPSVGALWALDLQRTLVRVRLVTTPVAVALAVILIQRYEGLGAVIAAGVATAATSLVELVLARRVVPFSYPVGFAGWAVVASGALALPALVLDPSGAGALLAAVVLGIVAMVLVAAIARPFRSDDVDALRRVSPRLSESWLRRFARV